MSEENTEGGWDRGVAFVRGINMFSRNRVTKEKMRGLCERIEDQDLEIVKVVRCDNVIFKKRDMHYATVGQKLEKVLSEYFEKPIHVTTRSMKTVKSLFR